MRRDPVVPGVGHLRRRPHALIVLVDYLLELFNGEQVMIDPPVNWRIQFRFRLDRQDRVVDVGSLDQVVQQSHAAVWVVVKRGETEFMPPPLGRRLVPDEVTVEAVQRETGPFRQMPVVVFVFTADLFVLVLRILVPLLHDLPCLVERHILWLDVVVRQHLLVPLVDGFVGHVENGQLLVIRLVALDHHVELEAEHETARVSDVLHDFAAHVRVGRENELLRPQTDVVLVRLHRGVLGCPRSGSPQVNSRHPHRSN